MDIGGKELCRICFTPCENDTCAHCAGKNHDARYTNTLKNGTMLMGKYVIGRVLGKGGFGITYLGYDVEKERKVAIKEYFPGSIVNRNTGEKTVFSVDESRQDMYQNGAKRFYDEAELLMRFNGNPNIINVQEFFYENNTAYFVMEYLEGTDLREYIAKNGGRLSEQETLSIFMKLTEALAIVHSINVLHRDIAPDNVYMCTDGKIKLIDFGAARQVSLSETQSLTEIYKPGFAPFEQYQRNGKQGPWTDIYALGATVYYMLKGVKVDDAPSRVGNETLDMSGISPALAKILTKMMAMEPKKRYQNITLLNTDLHKLIASPEPSESPKPPKGKEITIKLPEIALPKITLPKAKLQDKEKGKAKLPKAKLQDKEKGKAKLPKKTLITIGALFCVLILAVASIWIFRSDSYKSNVLDTKSFGYIAEKKARYDGVFGNEALKKDAIVSITFQKNRKGYKKAEQSWDASEKKDESVIAWITPATSSGTYHLFIGGEGGVSCGETAEDLFYDFTNVTEINFNGAFHTENVTDMSFMFSSCEKLKSLDLSGFHTENVMDMHFMFYSCDNLQSLDLSNFNTEYVTDMSEMFSFCKKLQSLDLSNFNTENVTDMSWMFAACDNLQSLDLSNFNTENVTDMSDMFYGCDNLQSLDLSNFDSSKVKDMEDIFKNSDKLTTVITNDAKIQEEFR